MRSRLTIWWFCAAAASCARADAPRADAPRADTAVTEALPDSAGWRFIDVADAGATVRYPLRRVRNVVVRWDNDCDSTPLLFPERSDTTDEEQLVIIPDSEFESPDDAPDATRTPETMYQARLVAARPLPNRPDCQLVLAWNGRAVHELRGGADSARLDSTLVSRLLAGVRFTR